MPPWARASSIENEPQDFTAVSRRELCHRLKSSIYPISQSISFFFFFGTSSSKSYTPCNHQANTQSPGPRLVVPPTVTASPCDNNTGEVYAPFLFFWFCHCWVFWHRAPFFFFCATLTAFSLPVCTRRMEALQIVFARCTSVHEPLKNEKKKLF